MTFLLVLFFFYFFYLCHNPLKQYFRKWQRSSVCKMSWSQTIRVIACYIYRTSMSLPSIASWNYRSLWSEAGVALILNFPKNFFASPFFEQKSWANYLNPVLSNAVFLIKQESYCFGVFLIISPRLILHCITDDVSTVMWFSSWF